MMDLTIENGCEVEQTRDQQGRTWISIDEPAKREPKWMPIEDLTKKTELNWIPIGD